MGFLAPKRSEIESVLLVHGGNRLKVHELVYTSKPGYEWSKTSRGWVINFFSFAGRPDLENIDRFWPNILKGERRIILALNELAAYYIFRTLQIGNNNFLNHNKIDKEIFIKEVSEILNLTENNRSEIERYNKNYGMHVMKKYFEASQFTKELSEEFSILKTNEMKELLTNIAETIKDIDSIPLPDSETIKKVEEGRSMNGIMFNEVMVQYALLPK